METEPIDGRSSGPAQHIHPSAPTAPNRAAIIVPVKMHRFLRSADTIRRILGWLCLANLCTVLTLGLWPFRAPKNDVSWLSHQHGLRFGRFGSVISSGVFPPQELSGESVAVLLEPKSIWLDGTILAFHQPGTRSQFSLRQSQRDLVLRVSTRNGKSVNLLVANVFSRASPVVLTVTSGLDGVVVYVDGHPVLNSASYPLNPQDFSGRLILGDAPGQNDTWSGLIFGLALYQRRLTPAEVSQQWMTWTQSGQPQLPADAGAIALYYFDEHAGNTIHNQAGSNPDLTIPQTYEVVDKIFLEPFWTEFITSWDYWGAALKNIVGFVPYGFCFYAWLLMLLPRNRAAVVAVALGTAASLTIEILQGFLPTRASGTSDIITNTFGTFLGVVAWRLLNPIMLRFFPWIWAAIDPDRPAGVFATFEHAHDSETLAVGGRRTSANVASQTMASGAKHVIVAPAGEKSGPWEKWRDLSRPRRLRFGGCTGYFVVLTLLFIQPLTMLMRYAAQSTLDSYIVLVPFISGYLLYIRRGLLFNSYRSSIVGAVTLGGVGIAALAAGVEWRASLSVNDDLTLMALAYVTLLSAGGFLFLGSQWMRAAAFPIAFLIFMVPLPDAAVNWLENTSAAASAEAAALFFNIVGTPLVRHGTVFELPRIVIQVAQECSGIHSSWVLFLSSLIASHLFLRTRWRRAALVAFVIPLGILRNGFRILVIGLLCVHVGPQMIDSSIHHRGGGLFFALSLVPLFLLLWYLRRQERRNLPS